MKFRKMFFLIGFLMIGAVVALAANTDLPNGFKPASGHPNLGLHKWPVAASQTIAVGDMVDLTSLGSIEISTSTTASVCGVAATPVTSSGSGGTDIFVYDNPLQVFEGQCSGSGLTTDTYTNTNLGSCFDIEGTTGIMEINEDASTYDIVKVVGVGRDAATGVESAYGANQRKTFMIHPRKHQLNITGAL